MIVAEIAATPYQAIHKFQLEVKRMEHEVYIRLQQAKGESTQKGKGG